MVKYIANLPLFAISASFVGDEANDSFALRESFFSNVVEPEINNIYDRLTTGFHRELQQAGIAADVILSPRFAYRNLWNEADPDNMAVMTSEDDPTTPGQRNYTINTALALSILIVYSDEDMLINVPAVIYRSLLGALKNTAYYDDEVFEQLFKVIDHKVKDESSSNYILYRKDHKISSSHPVPVLQVQSDVFQCRRVLKIPKYQWDQRVVYSENHGDVFEWKGIGTCEWAYAVTENDDLVSRGKLMFAKNEGYQSEYMNMEPLGSSVEFINSDIVYKHGDRLQNLFSRLGESRRFDRTLPGVVALKLQDGFISPNSKGIMPDEDGIFGGLQLISDADMNILNTVVFVLQNALNGGAEPRIYYCLQAPVDLSDLHKLLIASVGNVLVICVDRGNDEHTLFLHSDDVISMLSSFKNKVQLVFLYNKTYINEKEQEALKEGTLVDLPLEILLEQMNVAKNEVTWLDFSTLDIKFSDESKEYLHVVLADHSGDSKLIDSFLNQYEKKAETRQNVLKDFRIFRDNQLNTKLQHELNSIRKELGTMTEDDADREEITARMDYLASALRGASGISETRYSAAVDWNAELNSITGLDKVKEHIRGLKSVFAAKYARAAVNADTKNVFTFEGNPGCGKTMVARYFAYSLKQDGLITAAEPFHDIKISDIVGVHIGEASQQTDEIFKSCSGSVIFIDEAYALLDESSYGRSAINAIVKNISSMSPDTVLILAGYPADIGRLLKKNRGLESRVVKRIAFDDYSCDELLAILKNNLNANCGLYYNSSEAEEIENTIRDFLLRVSSCGEHNTGRSLGNARFIENLIGKLEIAHAATLTEEDLKNRISSSQMFTDMGEEQSADPEEIARANKLRTITLEIVNETLKELDEELKQTGSANGSTRPTYYVSTTDDDTFERIIGNTNAKKMLKRQLDIFKNPQKYRFAPSGTRGILLTGDPGCGKTLLARAMAHEAGPNVAFMSANGTDFIKGYLGQGAEALGALFDEVETYEKCILFIDEIDAIGSTRNSGSANAIESQVLMKLLTCLDGFRRRESFLVIAATNVPETLDPALKRRLGTQVSVELPNAEERLALLKLNLADRGSEDSISAEQLKALADYETLGFSGDRISKCVTAAYFDSDGGPITFEHLEAAVQGVAIGHNGNTRLNDADKKRTAYHEVGHAALAHKFGMPVLKVSIIPNDNGALGYTLSPLTDPDSHSETRIDLENQICVLLGGRAAEELFSENSYASSGCSEDLRRATNIALNMVARYGMGSTLRVRAIDDPAVTQEADKVIEACYARTKVLLTENAVRIHELTARLVEKETISKEDVENILSRRTANV